jgi:gamma-glutamylcyclotransferase (GGCT)/AIG2-like uncharacterized protein YtfP
MLLFVYGTMLRRGRNHTRLYERNAIYIGEYRTTDLFRMHIRVRGQVPVAIRDDSGYPVAGELYAIPDDEIEHVDACEGHPRVYERQTVELAGVAGMPAIQMYVYLGFKTKDEYSVAMPPDLDGALHFPV